MPPARCRVAALAVALALLAPATAWGQSAGDEQYQDPFAPGAQGGGGQSSPESQGGGGSSPGSTGGGQSSPGSTGGGSTGSTGSGGSSSGGTGAAPDTSVSSDDAAPAATAAAPAPAPGAESAQQQLPYSGSDAGLLAAGGALLLAGGVALRLRLRDRQ